MAITGCGLSPYPVRRAITYIIRISCHRAAATTTATFGAGTKSQVLLRDWGLGWRQKQLAGKEGDHREKACPVGSIVSEVRPSTIACSSPWPCLLQSLILAKDQVTASFLVRSNLGGVVVSLRDSGHGDPEVTALCKQLVSAWETILFQAIASTPADR